MSEVVVVDTDVVSFEFKGDSRADLYDRHIEGKQAVISFMTIAELYKWAEDRDWGERRRAQLEEHMRSFTRHASSEALCRIWAEVMTGAAREGRRIEVADAWIAATAIIRDVPLITHNGRHYEGVDDLAVICEA